MQTRIAATTLTLLIVGVLAGCGGSGGGSDEHKPSAYDAAFLKDMEQKVRTKLTPIDATAANVKDLNVACSADNDRAFTCESVMTVNVDGVCAELPSTQRGSLDPATGKSTWKTVVVPEENPISCDA